MGYGYDRPWRVATGGTSSPSRARTRGPGRCPAAKSSFRPIWIATAWSISGRRSKRCLNRLTDEAEAWAESGSRKAGQSERSTPRQRRSQTAVASRLVRRVDRL